MARPKRKQSNSGIHHIMLRGINKQDIFHDDDDFEKMLNTLDVCTSLSMVYIHAYCLMCNHVHLLVQETLRLNSETLSQFMKRVGIKYVTYYNSKYKRIGPLFQDRFRSEPVDSDAYFLTVLRYIHRNPVKASFVKTSAMYKWSSYNAYNTGHPSFVYTDMGKQMLGSFFDEYMNTDDVSVCLDIEQPETCLTDTALSENIEGMLNMPITNIATLGRPARDELLRSISNIDGVTLRQLSRVTGLARSTIANARNNKDAIIGQ